MGLRGTVPTVKERLGSQPAIEDVKGEVCAICNLIINGVDMGVLRELGSGCLLVVVG